MKTCTKCKIEKPFEDFGKNRTKKDGLCTWCKDCRNQQKNEYRKTARGKAARAKTSAAYRAREGQKEKQDAYNEVYRNVPKNKAKQAAYMAEYLASPKGKAATAKRRANYVPSEEWEIKKHLPHTMYLIRFTQGNRTYIKPGITRKSIQRRFSTDIYHSRMSNFEILDSITFKDFETCSVAESIIHDATLDSHVTPVIAFNGSVSECRQPEALEQIISMFDSARAGLDNTN